METPNQRALEDPAECLLYFCEVPPKLLILDFGARGCSCIACRIGSGAEDLALPVAQMECIGNGIDDSPARCRLPISFESTDVRRVVTDVVGQLALRHSGLPPESAKCGTQTGRLIAVR